jgi:hypothetical protein
LVESVQSKGARLFAQGKVKKDMDSDRRTYFLVQGETDEHSVVFDKAKDLWSCDCKYNTTKVRECSHIFACKLQGKAENKDIPKE